MARAPVQNSTIDDAHALHQISQFTEGLEGYERRSTVVRTRLISFADNTSIIGYSPREILTRCGLESGSVNA